jgi:small subunit ribosomal protein S20
MANTKSAAKRARQTVRRATANRASRTKVRNLLKTVRTLIAEGKKSEAETTFRAFSSAMDKAVKTGRFHQNKASRHKSTLAQQIAKLS